MQGSTTLRRIGGHDSLPTGHTVRLAAAFAAIYLIWGSTYLAIKVVVAVAPPLMVAAARCLTAGAILIAWAAWCGVPMPGRADWARGTLAGAMMFLVGHGTLFWASQRVASGFAAILVATIPIWVVAFSVIGPRGKVPARRTVAGLALGTGGVAWLNLPGAGGVHDPLASAALLTGAATWAVAILWYKRPRRPESSVLAAAIPLLTGGALLVVASVLIEDHQNVSVATMPLAAIASFAYLVAFGSVVAFSAFAWLINVTNPAAVSSYAFVNPIVAVILGWGIGGEAFPRAALLPAAAILVSVMLIVTGGRAEREH